MPIKPKPGKLTDAENFIHQQGIDWKHFTDDIMKQLTPRVRRIIRDHLAELRGEQSFAE